MKIDSDSKPLNENKSEIPNSLPSDFAVDDLDVLTRNGLMTATYKSLKSGQKIVDQLNSSQIAIIIENQIIKTNNIVGKLNNLVGSPLSLEELSLISSECLDYSLKMLEDLKKIQSENFQSLEQLENYQQSQRWFLKTLYGSRSERSPRGASGDKDVGDKKGSNEKNTRGKDKRPGKLSEKYPHLEKEYYFIYLNGTTKSCSLCDIENLTGEKFEVSELLETRPKQHYIRVVLREKSLGTEGCETAKPLVRIVPFGVYSDSFIIDLILTKFADLCPYSRSRDIVYRDEDLDLPVGAYYKLFQDGARFLECLVEKIKSEIKNEKFIYMDETPYKLLERYGEVKSWYCWGFASLSAVVFLVKNTRGHVVPLDFVSESLCEIFMSDKYGGYNAIDNSIEGKNKKKEIKEFEKGFRKLIRALCNSHARRNFKNAPDEAKEFYIEKYKEIYKLEAETKLLDPETRLVARSKMLEFFNEMKAQAMADLPTVSSKSVFGKALNYFLSSFEQLTIFTKNLIIDLDNNHMERLLRSVVQGRKIWYGSHSPKAAYAAQILFSITMSGKLCNINLRTYLTAQIERLHAYTGEDYYNYPIDERPADWQKLEAQRQDLIMTPREYHEYTLKKVCTNTG